MFNRHSISGFSLDAAGLLALASLKTIAYRTMLTGSASFLDVLLLAPGIHCQQDVSDVNGGEYPVTGAMTTGYVFRVENQATVAFLQGVGEPGHLTNVFVSPEGVSNHGIFFDMLKREFLASILYLIAISLTVVALTLLAIIRDWWALGVVGMLILARTLNTIVIKRRSVKGWKGAKEPDVKGDLLILLSQDRWVRMRGLVDDLKDVTAGQWLREPTNVENMAVSVATLLVYGSAALARNASTIGSLLMAVLLLASVALLGAANTVTKRLMMFGHVVGVAGPRKNYVRRLHMVNELIEETGRDDWAIGMGLFVPPADKVQKYTV